MKQVQAVIHIFTILSMICLSSLSTGCIKIENANEVAKSPEAPPLEKPTEKEPELNNEEAPPAKGFQVKFETTKGEFIVEVDETLAPVGAKRFYNLVKSGFYDQCRFFRVMPGFMVQFGINGDPGVNTQWKVNIPDDPVKTTNKKGTITFATSGPDSRTTQVFINYADNSFLDGQGFSPFGKVIKGMEVVESIESKHGETPDQMKIQNLGNTYLIAKYPDLDYITKATIYDEEAKKKDAEKAGTNDAVTSEATKPEMKPEEKPKETNPEASPMPNEKKPEELQPTSDTKPEMKPESEQSKPEVVPATENKSENKPEDKPLEKVEEKKAEEKKPEEKPAEKAQE